jgi:hypothetical protein
LASAIPADLITVTASSEFNPVQAAKHLVDGSGMTLGVLHDNQESATTMWHTCERPKAGRPARDLSLSPAWVRFDFAQPQQFETILIWNHNQEKLTDRGFRKARIYGSSDGVAWDSLTSPEIVELPRASGSPLAEPIAIKNGCAGHTFKSVIIAAEAADGNFGSEYYGLSAVRFVGADALRAGKAAERLPPR